MKPVELEMFGKRSQDRSAAPPRSTRIELCASSSAKWLAWSGCPLSSFLKGPSSGLSSRRRPVWATGGSRLNAAGLAWIYHIAATPLEMLELLLRGQAAQLRKFADGIDDRLLIPAREPQKTFSEQQTFGSDLTDEDFVAATLKRMADDLFAKVRQESRSVRTLTVRVRYNDMGEDQVSESLIEPADLETNIYGRLHTMVRTAWKRRVSIRLVSLKLSNVYDGRFRADLPLEISPERLWARERFPKRSRRATVRASLSPRQT
jgi:hypothetical protein